MRIGERKIKHLHFLDDVMVYILGNPKELQTNENEHLGRLLPRTLHFLTPFSLAKPQPLK